jgi:hypothetical protein
MNELTMKDKQALVSKAFRYTDDLDGDALMSHYSSDFDMEFLAARSTQFGSTPSPLTLHTASQHIELFTDPKAVCDPSEK